MPVSDRKRFYAALLERVLWTFFQSLAAFYILDGAANIDGLDNGDKFKAALIAGGISVVKNVLGSQFGNGGTPAWLPTNYDPATPPGTDPNENALTGNDKGQVDINLLGTIIIGIVIAFVLIVLLQRVF